MKLRGGFVSNSSTSSFVCETEMDLEEVRERLQNILVKYNSDYGTSLDFDTAFQEPFIADEKYANGWWGDYYAAIDNSEGKIIVQSKQDNSIPYEMWEDIKDTFHAERVDLG